MGSVKGVPWRTPLPLLSTTGRYASYWNALLFFFLIWFVEEIGLSSSHLTQALCDWDLAAKYFSFPCQVPIGFHDVFYFLILWWRSVFIRPSSLFHPHNSLFIRDNFHNSEWAKTKMKVPLQTVKFKSFFVSCSPSHFFDQIYSHWPMLKMILDSEALITIIVNVAFTLADPSGY